MEATASGGAAQAVRRGAVSFEHAYGAFLGLLCGDAAGATLEFAPGAITEQHVTRAMTMPGGGVFRLGKGQVTDDSELALSLARGLLGHRPRDGFPLESVARQYAAWCASEPFDIGKTCASAFSVEAGADGNVAPAMRQAAQTYCTSSQANGALMRVTPLAIWSAGQTQETIATFARAEATLSHPNQVCQDCNAVYCLMLEHLLRHPGDAQGAILRAEQFVTASVHSSAREWFLSESLDVDELVCTKQVGHARWAFVLATHFLRRRESYERAIQQTLLKGGDTDTNAAIVGGLMGALHGVEAIPQQMREAVLNADCTGVSATARPRPEIYRGAHVTALAKQLVEELEEE